MIKYIILIPLVLIFSGCASTPKSCNGVMGNIPYLAEDSNSDPYKKIAEESYIYAQMSSNAYDKKEKNFSLPSNIKLARSVNKGWGFQAQIYEIYDSNQLNQVVIAYRGTNSISDWIWGNILSKQYKLADELYKEVKANYAGIKIVATGHSLGGGLALHTSAVEDNVDAYTFNPSYRVHRKGDEKDNKRIVIAETGDILKFKRFLWKNPKNNYYGDFYCTDINNHSIYLLARCTTHVAAIRDESAQRSIFNNPSFQCQ